ncbi:MAG: hypothetical protein H0X22_07115 [Acidimicrobiia bacterium]|nr:hypothetical protein [Acidimicrobiia bacterium]
MHRTAAAAAALCLLAAASACTSERESSATPIGTETVTSASGSRSGSASATAAQTTDSPTTEGTDDSSDGTGSGPTTTPTTGPAATTIPAGTVLVESSTLGIAFAVPETYTELDPTELGDDFYTAPAFEELALRAGLSAEEFELFLNETVDLYVFAPATSEGYVDNITAQGLEGTALPSEDQLSQTLQGLGATDLQVETTSAGDVDYVRGVYTLMIGNQAVFGVDTQLLLDGSLVELTVTASSRDIADELGTVVLGTVRSV